MSHNVSNSNIVDAVKTIVSIKSHYIWRYIRHHCIVDATHQNRRNAQFAYQKRQLTFVRSCKYKSMFVRNCQKVGPVQVIFVDANPNFGVEHMNEGQVLLISKSSCSLSFVN